MRARQDVLVDEAVALAMVMQDFLGGSFAKRHCGAGGCSLGLASRTAPRLRERDHMTAKSKQTEGVGVARRLSMDLAMLIAIGLLMGFLGPFGSDRVPDVDRYIYWMICMVGGGVIGIAADTLLRVRIAETWRRVAIVAVSVTPPVSLLVLTTEHLLLAGRWTVAGFIALLWQVLPIVLVVMTVRALVWRRPPARVETRTVIAPPLPEAEATFRRRLSAKRRGARLIAIEAHDHYLKVHTDAGEELITLRFVDALDELAQAHGWRIHRSWWVAGDAVETVRWRRGVGQLRLVGGLTAPVSRTYGPALKQAGWF